MEGCTVTKHRVLIDPAVTGPVLQSENLIVMGSHSIASRTCALRGVAKFKKVNGDWSAQIDPNLRDPQVIMIAILMPAFLVNVRCHILILC